MRQVIPNLAPHEAERAAFIADVDEPEVVLWVSVIAAAAARRNRRGVPWLFESEG